MIASINGDDEEAAMMSYSKKYDNVHFLFRTKVELIASQTAALDAAVAAASADEEGPWKNWHALASRDLLYVPLIESEGEPLGVLQLGGFSCMTSAGAVASDLVRRTWWPD